MKNIILFICFLFTSSTSFSQTYFSENFDYASGDSLNGLNGWIGFAGPANPLKVVSPGLVFSGYALSGIGNALKLDTTGQDAYKYFGGNSFIDSTNSNAVYLACLVK